ncbi:MAG: nucleoside-diphosphate sugar epimerase/dehydratase [Wenzhouxiangellaceae bacterium]|nr:nucleoside-diphosphate sugar epimerase/dehydratase [Wenzhouxiangellaceae bacterium]
MKSISSPRLNRHHQLRAMAAAHDLVMAVLAWAVARAVVTVVFEAAPGSPLWLVLEGALLLLIQGFIYWRIGLYRGLWRFASLPDLGNLLRVSLLGTVAIGAVLLILEREVGVIAPMLWLYPLLLLVALGVPRLVVRVLKDMRSEARWRREVRRTLIIGAGRSGRMLLPELRRRGGFDAIGFLDDKRVLHGSEVDGVPVLGPVKRLGRYVSEAAADLVVIAIPSATNQQMQRLVALCEEAGVEFLTLPGLSELDQRPEGLTELKPVAIDDLLGRDPVRLDWAAIRSGLAGKRVLVTGGGGSIGAELCRQIARLDPAGLVVLDQSEYNLYRIDYRLRSEFHDLVFDAVLGDICDPATVERVMARHQPEVVFHAAAYKHLPMLQNQVREAVRNNVIGTHRVAEAALRHQVGTFVLISTDKAVNPSNVMGATKRIAELDCQAMNSRSSTRFITVRFGNVLNSTGSVVPLFNEQIRRGGPVTVTHPEITRYFMTIAEASQLILQAAVLGRGGEVFVLDMGEPVRISFLAEQLIRLAGRQPGRDIEIVYTGLRPGEKLFEELFHEHEAYSATAHPKILLAREGRPVLAELDELLAQAEQAVIRYDSDALRRILVRIVPEIERVPPPDRKVVPLVRS